MSVIRVNMARASKGGAPIPDGDYLCEVVSLVEGESSQKHSPQLNVQLEIHDGPLAGGKMVDFISMSEKSDWRVANFFKACGQEVPLVDESEEVNIDLDTYSRLNADGDEVQEQGALVMVTKRTSDEDDRVTGEKRRRINLYYTRPEGTNGQAEEAEAEAEEAPAPPARPAGAPKPALAAKKPLGRPPGKKITIKA